MITTLRIEKIYTIFVKIFFSNLIVKNIISQKMSDTEEIADGQRMTFPDGTVRRWSAYKGKYVTPSYYNKIRFEVKRASEIGVEAFNEARAKQQREYRERKAQQAGKGLGKRSRLSKEYNDITMADFENQFDLKSLSESSKKKYLSQFKILRHIMDAKKDPHFLRKMENVARTVDKAYDNLQTKIGYISLATTLSSRSKTKIPEAITEKYRKYLKGLTDKHKNELKKNRLNGKQESRFLHWSDLVSSINLNGLNQNEFNVVKLYTKVAPRRAEYHLLKIIQKKNKKSKLPTDKKFNYLVLNKNGQPIRLIFNNYKTSNTYGAQSFDLNDGELDGLDLSGKENGDFLFTGVSGKEYSQPNFSALVSESFQKAMGTPLSINDLRHIFITGYISNSKLSDAEKEKIAERMGHSLSTAMEYRKIF